MIKEIVSILTLSTVLFSNSLNQIVPQKDVNSTMFLVNRQNLMSKNYIPLTVKADVAGSSRFLREDAAKALEDMFTAAKEEADIVLTTTSGYRSYSRQKTIYQNKINKVGKDKAGEYVAPAGASEHQLGLAMDLGAKGVNVGLNSKFGQTKPGKWVTENAHRFGFIIRYQQGWENITGYSYEPWHIRYVGVKHAMQMYKQNIPMEEYSEACQLGQLLYFLTWEGEK